MPPAAHGVADGAEQGENQPDDERQDRPRHAGATRQGLDDGTATGAAWARASWETSSA